MKRKSSKNKIIIPVVAVVLVVAIATVVFVPALINKNAKNFNFSNPVTAQELAFNQYDKKLGEDVSFLYDSKTSVFGIALANGGVVAGSQNKSAAENSLATIFTIRLRDRKGNTYSLDSSSNSIAFGGAEEYMAEENRFGIKYTLYPTADVKEKDNVQVKTVGVPVVFSCKNNGLRVSVNVSEIQLPDGWFVEKISILPGLFSVNSGSRNVFYTVPDGCGAQIDVGARSEKPLALDLNVYGEDVTFYDYSEGAVLPFFALTKNGVSINTIIEDGDALSRITCKRFENGGGYLYNTFTITPCSNVDGKLVKGETYTGVVSQLYMVADNNADYNTIAAQVRDNLTARNYLNASAVTSFSDLPFFINVIGSDNGKNELTAFESAAEITALLKSRGVRNIALRFTGYGKKGLDTLADTLSASEALGGSSGLKNLKTEIIEQGNSLYLDANVLADKNGYGKRFAIYDEISKFLGVLPSEFSLSGSGELKGNVGNIYKFATDSESAKVCLNDGASVLYTDLKGKVTRQGVLEQLSSSVSTLSATGGLMLSYPAVYLMKQADSVFSTPNTASCEGEAGVTVVPVLQMVLHGSVVYGSVPVNVSNLSSEDALLKCAEYGCVPSFLFTHSAETNISYTSYATQTTKLYSKAKKLAPVMNMKMTSHEKVTDGVYKITYDYSKIVYVNYNPSVVEVNGVMISAKDFIVI